MDNYKFMLLLIFILKRLIHCNFLNLCAFLDLIFNAVKRLNIVLKCKFICVELVQEVLSMGKRKNKRKKDM